MNPLLAKCTWLCPVKNSYLPESQIVSLYGTWSLHTSLSLEEVVLACSGL